MKIRIISNNPPEDVKNVCSDISKYIGQEFETYYKYEDESVNVLIDGIELTIWPEEFEYVED